MTSVNDYNDYTHYKYFGFVLSYISAIFAIKIYCLETFDIIAKTLFGLEEVLAKELQELGATNIEILTRAVKYKGNDALLYKSNLHLRTALSILKPIKTFMVHNENQLYDGIKSILWSNYFTTKNTFAIDSVVNSDFFSHSKFVALKSKDAIADQFREASGIRPSIDTENPDIRINIHITGNSCTVSLDSSGNTLDKRGYRLSHNAAPINELLAAGIILLTDWNKQSDFFDPMCGSGTFTIEAALIASNTAPGNFRNFSFEKWIDFKPTLWEEIKKEAVQKQTTINCKIIGSDLDSKSIDISMQNARRAKVEHLIKFERMDFFKSRISLNNAILVMNPPYGERLDQEDIITFYKEIGNQLKHNFNGCEAWIISANLEALKFIGLKPSKKIKLFNGALECRLNKFELYRGSTKEHKTGLNQG
jgi:putative N6-adenine-specific DNA methylase